MERTRFIEHRGRQIVLLDYSNITNPRVALEEIDRSRRFIAAQRTDGLLRTLTVATGARYNAEVVAALKELTVQNAPFVGSAAVVTDSSVQRVLLNTVSMFSKRKFQSFADVQAAMEWLVAQPDAVPAA